MKKWIVSLLLLAVVNPVRSQHPKPLFGDSLRQDMEKIREAERKLKTQERELEKKIQERNRGIERRHTIRIDANTKDAEDSLFRIDIQLGALDSIIKNIPIPKNIEIDEHRIRILQDSLLHSKMRRMERPTERKNIVKFGEDVIVGRNEVVQGDVVVVDGNATVYGIVEGGVVVVKGDIRLASTSRVKGDLVCVWGNTEMDPGARAGSTNVINPGKVFDKLFSSKVIPSLFFLIRLLRTVFLLGLALLIGAAFPEPTRRVRRCIEKSYPKSLAAGIMVFLILPFLFIVLIITVLGIPIAILLLPLAIAGAFLLGITAFANLAGQWLLERFNVKNASFILCTTVGILVFEAPSLLGKPVSLLGPLFAVFSILVGVALFLLVWTPAFGASVLTRFGRAPKTQTKQP